MGSLPLPTKFPDNIERLQQIYRTRNAPVGAQIKRVLDLLFEKRQPLDAQEINRACFVDVNSNKDVFNSLKTNPKVHFDGVHFSYKPTHCLTNRDELFSLIKNSPDGISVGDVKDEYTGVVEDLKSLRVAGKIWLISDVAFPIDPRYNMGVVDDGLKDLYRGIELPAQMVDIENYLKKYGIKPATNTARRMETTGIHPGMLLKPKAQEKKKKFRITKRTKLTNIHLPEFFNL